MEMATSKQNEILQVQMNSEMTSYNVAELKQSLYQEWDKVSELILNLSSVDELDAAGIQLLLQLKLDSEALNKPVRFIEHSPLILETLELLNLIGHFADPVVLAAEQAEVSG